MREKKLKTNLKERSSSENLTKPSTFVHEMPCNSSLNNQSFTMFSSQQQQNWGDPSLLDYSMRIPPSLSKLNQLSKNSSLSNANPDNQKGLTNQEGQMNQMLGNDRTQDWDPRTMLNNLSFLEQKIQQLQELIHKISGQRAHGRKSQDELLTQQQQLITADLTSIIVQLISTAGSLLPSVKHSLSDVIPSAAQLNAVPFLATSVCTGGGQVPQTDTKAFEYCVTEMNCSNIEEEHESKDDDDGKEEHLPPGSYEILQLEKEEILAPHTHFCTICGKGFKRDANLRMHMRGHGDEYKTPAALAKPNKDSSSKQVLLKRYSCPYVGCKRNKDHKKFQPLKTILCVKNHYKRTHCDKSYICSRCHTKKFSVIADLKTHEKHCGRDKWLCSCGTTFSRKDKLFGHVALFQGHTPAIPLDDNKLSAGAYPSENSKSTDKDANVGFRLSSNVGDGDGNGIQSLMDVKGNVEDPFLSLLNYDCSFGGLQDFLQANFDDTPNSFSFLMNGGEKSGMQSGSNDMDL